MPEEGREGAGGGRGEPPPLGGGGFGEVRPFVGEGAVWAYKASRGGPSQGRRRSRRAAELMEAPLCGVHYEFQCCSCHQFEE